ncbi:efflux RND transporter periplasmic adaptor subunit [Limnohabitans sp. Rim8]|uniref:efflux RND transporter periplasmic adaptor subunit n=1 Tax=Limnohabitans sp. Rim8 TaxID=1100718 RepID=UPI00262DE78B|nr:efflux RND transporter periplasmic adaptor subunit [Limnohabitans sp. Rim8]
MIAHSRSVICTLLLVTLVIGGCSEPVSPTPSVAGPVIQGDQLQYPPDHPQIALLTTTAAVMATEIPVDLPARIVWNEERTQRVFSAFSGRVSSIDVSLGQAIAKGQALAHLSSPEFGAAQAETSLAQTNLNLATQVLDRQQSLFDLGVVARKDVEQAAAEAARANAELKRAQAKTDLYGSRNTANQQLVLRSDVAGVVVERNITPGQEVRPDNASQALFVISDPSKLWVQIDAQTPDIADLKPNAQVQLVVPSLSEQVFKATVLAVADQIDPVSRSIKVRALIDNSSRLLKSEMLARVRYARKIGQGVEVPASALFLMGKQHIVFVQTSKGVYGPRQVTLSQEGPVKVVLSQGLQIGEEVVVQNGLLLARELRIAKESAAITGAAKP